MAVEHDRREQRCDENGMDAKLVRIRKMGHFWDLAFAMVSQQTPLMGEGEACGGGGCDQCVESARVWRASLFSSRIRSIEPI